MPPLAEALAPLRDARQNARLAHEAGGASTPARIALVHLPEFA